MDPVSAILAALAAGAAAAAKETAGAAIKDAYEGLKSMLKSRLAGGALAGAAVDAHATEPQPAETVLRPALTAAGLDRDEAVLAAAKALLAMADADGKFGSRYKLEISGDVQGVVQGDHASVTMNFGNPPSGKG